LTLILKKDEENGLRGGHKYAEIVAQEGPKPMAAIESDRGLLLKILAGKDFKR
jgi:hypothetical protein